MSNQPVAHQFIAHIGGTNPISSSTSIAYAKSSPTFIIVFKRNIYVELKSISILNEQTNVRKYQIDFIDHDQTILQTIIIDKQQNQSKLNFDMPIGALQIKYLETIDGCLGINLDILPETTTTK